MSPVRLLVKAPVPVPLVVEEPVIVGFAEIPQHTPLATTSAPPSEVTSPPDAALVVVISEMATVVTTGISGSFLHPWSYITPESKHKLNSRLKTFFILIYFSC